VPAAGPLFLLGYVSRTERGLRAVLGWLA